MGLEELPQPAGFECLEEKFKHGTHVFRKPNTYQLEDYPDIGKKELFMFWRAGWVKVDGWPETPKRDPNRKITLNVQNVKHLGKSPKVGTSNG